MNYDLIADNIYCYILSIRYKVQTYFIQRTLCQI